MGVRALSRALAWTVRKAVSSSMPVAMRAV